MIYRLILDKSYEREVILYSRDYHKILTKAFETVKNINALDCWPSECIIEELYEAYDETTALANKLSYEDDDKWIPNGGVSCVTEVLVCDYNEALARAKNDYTRVINKRISEYTSEDYDNIYSIMIKYLSGDSLNNNILKEK